MKLSKLILIAIIMLSVGSGCEDEWSNTPPDGPGNPSPADNAVLASDGQITLSWQGSDKDLQDTLTYDVWFGKTGSMNRIALNNRNRSLNVNVDRGESYEWKVTAFDKHSATDGQIWRFSVAQRSNHLPGAPSEPFPADGDSVTIAGDPGDLAVRWRASSDPDSDPIRYTVWYCEEGETLAWTTTTNQPSTSLRVTRGTAYNWVVYAYDGIDSTAGPRWTTIIRP